MLSAQITRRTSLTQFEHLPVLMSEALDLLNVQPNGDVIDATVGGGGHAERVLDLSSPDGKLLGLDADPDAVDVAATRLARFGSRVVLDVSFFDRLTEVSRAHGFVGVPAILFDLGVSSWQLDAEHRGFSFQSNGPLDMRLGPDAPQSAADIVNNASEQELSRIFFEYGEERYARRIARRIVGRREQAVFINTGDLADLVVRTVPGRQHRIHPATRVFQALRIAVNDELGRLERALPQALSLIRNGGRLVVISFHSLEDRIVKRFFRSEEAGCICPPEVPICVCGHEPRLRIVTRKPIRPSPAEVEANPRSRSARLRAAEALA